MHGRGCARAAHMRPCARAHMRPSDAYARAHTDSASDAYAARAGSPSGDFTSQVICLGENHRPYLVALGTASEGTARRERIAWDDTVSEKAVKPVRNSRKEAQRALATL